MADASPRLSVIIPAYNEENRIGRTLLSVERHLDGQGYDFEVLVINDGSGDGTAEVVDRFKRTARRLRLIDNAQNHGKGWAVRQGMLAAQGKFRAFMDADNSATIDLIEKAWPLFGRGCDLVIGTRDARDNREAKQVVKQNFLKRLLGNIGNLIIQVLAVPGIWDTQCGFKVFSAKAAEAVFSRSLIDRWGFDIEALAIARRLGFRIGLIPTNWVNDPESKVTWAGYAKTFVELLAIKKNLVSNRYRLRQHGKVREIS